MADAKLQIIIETLNKASKDLEKLRGDLEGVNDVTKNANESTKSFGESWQGAVTGFNQGWEALTKVYDAAKKVYDTAREGADLMYLEDRFDRLTESINTTSDALLGDLKDATRGLYSDAELIESAGQIMSLGLAGTHDEVVRLTSVAGALNMDMNQLVLTLTNQTTARFDQLNVSTDGFKERLAELEAQGMSTDDAFTEAFLQQAEEQIEKVGHAADSAKGSFDRLEASVANRSNQIKTDIARIIGPAVEWLADGLDEMSASVDALDEAYARNLITEKEYYQVKNGARTITGSLTGDTEYLTEAIIAYDAAVDQTAEDLIEASIQQALYGEAAEDSIGPVEDLTGATISADLAMRSYNEALLFAIASEGLTEEQALALAEAMGLVDENTVYATEMTNLFRQRLDNGQISVEEYNNLVAALANNLDRITSRDATIRINTQYYDEQGLYTGYTPYPPDNATGGSVSAGNLYNWQEYGYRGEAFVPSQDGYVLSRSDAARIMQGGGGADVAALVSRIPTAQDIARAVRDAILMVN